VDLIAVGDVMLDVRTDAPSLARGGDVHGRVVLAPGGTSANAAVWAVWDGGSARVHARVGDDLAGRLLEMALAERGVEPALRPDPEAPTGTMLVVVDAGERSMVADRGASARLSPGDLPPILEAGAVLVSGYLVLHPATTDVAVEAIRRARGPFVAVDAASWPLIEGFGADRFLDETSAAGATVVLANDREAEVLTGRSGLEAALALGERFRIAAVKRGASGAALVLDGSCIDAAAEPIEEVDPTGAGDAFDGVLLAGLGRSFEPEEALRRACHAGALVAASHGNWPNGVRA
jgi:sugar/nucleoside kinase (ribokinase family)